MARRRRRSRSRMPVGVIVVITLLIGAGLGILIYRLLQRPAPSQTKAVTPVKPPVPPLAPPVPEPRGPAPGLPAATQFDFYTILPEIHHRHHGVFPHAHAPPAPRVPTAAVMTDHYILQAASFPDPADANRLLATLALHGVSAYIERVSITGRGAFYRVRVGPLHRRQLAHDRHILATLGLQPIVLREARGN